MATDFPKIFKRNETFTSFVRRVWEMKDFSQIERFIDERYLINISSFNIFASGYSNLNFIAETNLGKLIVRISRPRKSADSIYFEEKVSIFLKSKGISVRVPILGKKGELFFDLPYGYTVEVLTYIEGKTWPDDWNLGVVASSGELLGKIHSLSRDFGTSLDTPRLDIYEKIKDIQNTLNQEKGLDTKVFSTLNQCVAFLDTRSLLDSPLSILHGDFGPSNLVFEGNKASGVFDFEGTCFGPSFYDFGIGVAQWAICQNSWNHKEISESFRRGYSAYAPVFDEELVLFMEKICLLDRICATISFSRDYESGTYWKEELRFFENMLRQIS
jgi:homoserine kinase type II